MTPLKKKKEKDKIKGTSKKSLGVQIGEIYCEVMNKLVKLVIPRPGVEELKPKVLELQEKAITQLVELGKKRESLEEGAKGMLNYEVMNEMQKISREDFKSFSYAVNYYRPMDNNFANTIAELNTITQYTDFELLKKQKPKEFERLRNIINSELVE